MFKFFIRLCLLKSPLENLIEYMVQQSQHLGRWSDLKTFVSSVIWKSRQKFGLANDSGVANLKSNYSEFKVEPVKNRFENPTIEYY